MATTPPAQPTDVQQNIGDVTTVSGSIEIIGAQANYFYGYSAVLLQQELYLVHKVNTAIVPPSNAGNLLAALRNERLLLLSAPAYWRQSYVAEYLASAILDERKTDEATPLVYSLTSEASASAFLDALRDETYMLKGAVIIASGVRADKYKANPTLLSDIVAQAKTRDAYLILTTEEKQAAWGSVLTGDLKALFFDLLEVKPYTDDDLTSWLQTGLQPQGTTSALSADSTLPDIGETVAAVAQRLGAPGALQRFINAAHDFDPLKAAADAKAPKSLKEILDSIQSEKVEESVQRIQKWFDDLQTDEQYLVLTISLLDGLRQETFWAIYEQLTHLAWRERYSALAMRDYHDIEVKLDQFVSATGDQVRFHNVEERRLLVNYALDGYRRSLVQALPVLADIVSGASQPVTTETGSLAGRLRVLDIFGSELEPTGENRQRQERLRNSIANSIAQIAQREPATTQHLLLAWASGTGDADSTTINTRLRIAVTITLVQMLTIEAPDEAINGSATHDERPWYQRHTAFALLNQWYRRYYGSDALVYSQSAQETEERHRNIRATMALALCHIGRHMTEDSFGTLDDTVVKYAQVPATPTDADQLKSPWDMLLALAWDTSPEVSVSIIEGLPVLMQRQRQHADKLILLLASDWSTLVRREMAELLAALYTQNIGNVYLVNYLLAQHEALVEQTPALQAGHYLRRIAINARREYPPHLWTAVLTMFYIGQVNEPAFRSFLQTQMREPASEPQSTLETRRTAYNHRLAAFNDVLSFVLANADLRDRFQDTSLLFTLTDTNAEDKRPSTVSNLLKEQLRGFIAQGALQSNVESLSTQIFASLRGRYRRPPEPTENVLRRELSRVVIRDEGIERLLAHYARSSDPHLRRQVQRILQTNPVGTQN